MLEAKKTPLRVTFVLPMPGTKPSGGYKNIYELTNHLARAGHIVSVVHPAIFRVDEPITRLPPKTAARTIWTYIANKLTGNYKPTAWFKMEPSVKVLLVPSLTARHMPDGDAVIATAWQTAEWLPQYPASKGKKFYFIQHFESWSGPEDRVSATWKLPLTKIVVAPWLQEIAESMGETACLIPNGHDFERFKVTRPLDDRDPNNLMMLYHDVFDWKGSADGLAAFEIARKQFPGLKLTLFATGQPPATLPAGVEFRQNPPQPILRDLYNQTSIFLSPSWAEGFPLPPAEAMQCGAALVGTDIGGTRMYAIHEQTALLSPIKDPQAMADNILRLLRDPELRLRLARDGNAFIQQFTWERAGRALEEVLLNTAGQ